MKTAILLADSTEVGRGGFFFQKKKILNKKKTFLRIFISSRRLLFLVHPPSTFSTHHPIHSPRTLLRFCARSLPSAHPRRPACTARATWSMPCGTVWMPFRCEIVCMCVCVIVFLIIACTATGLQGLWRPLARCTEWRRWTCLWNVFSLKEWFFYP